MIVDVLILAGGRSSRLAGRSKALLLHDGVPLAVRALDAVPDARLAVLVGDVAALSGALAGRAALVTREDPPFAGPAAGIAAGFRALEADAASHGLPASDFTLVLACDMPRVAVAVGVLLAAGYEAFAGARKAADPADSPGVGQPSSASPRGDGSTVDGSPVDESMVDGSLVDGFVARSPDGHPQFLAALYGTRALGRNIAERRDAESLDNLSVRALVAGLDLVPVDVPDGATDDVDTPDDAIRLGIGLP